MVVMAQKCQFGYVRSEHQEQRICRVRETGEGALQFLDNVNRLVQNTISEFILGQTKGGGIK